MSINYNTYQTYNPNNAVLYSSWTTTTIPTTNTSSTYNYNYKISPKIEVYNWNPEDIYSDAFAMYFTDTMDGLVSYIFSENYYNYIDNALTDIFEEYEDPQDFEDNVYRIVLDILYEISTEKPMFSMFFDENNYPIEKINKFIQKVINTFNANHLTEEYYV
jgi:hypothetical protein